MTRAMLLGLMGLGLIGLTGPATAEDKDAKGEVVELDGLKSAVPAGWKSEDAGKMRYLQFKLPHAEGDKEDAELVVYKGFGGTAEQNIARWKGSFKPPTGKTLDDASTVTKLEIAGRPVTIIDITGTYTAPQFTPNAKPEPKDDMRMLGVHFEGKSENYHFKLVGPVKTIAQHKAAFEEWLKALK